MPRQARGHGAAYDAYVREVAGGPCALRLESCDGIATGGDYVIPLSRGGAADRSNLRPACGSCNSARGNRIAVG